MDKNVYKSGFTLIELLVVVLIIGILAAIALPQYEKAIIRTRMAGVKQTLYQLKQAEQSYYLANGSYTKDLTALDIDVGATSFSGTYEGLRYNLPCGGDVEPLATGYKRLAYQYYNYGIQWIVWLEEGHTNTCSVSWPTAPKGKYGSYVCQILLQN